MASIDSTLQENLHYGDKPMFPVILKFGLIGSGIFILILILQRFAFPSPSGEDSALYMILGLVAGFVNFAVYVLAMALAANTYKKLNGGFLSLGKSFGVTFLTGLVMAIVAFIFSIILMYAFGLNMGDANELFSDMSEPSAIGIIAMASGVSLLGGCFVGAIIALIISLIVKREKPIAFNVN